MLQLSAEAQPDEGRLRGRVEHVGSGRAAYFDSVAGLVDFVKEIVARET